MSPKIINREDDYVYAQPVEVLPFARWKGMKREYALSVDVSSDVLQMNVVVNKKVIKKIPIHELVKEFID
jgi:hypothetical protein